MNENNLNKIKNSYPVKEQEHQTSESAEREKQDGRERISVLNIGQILFLAFLFVMLLVQLLSIYHSTDISALTDMSNTSDISDMTEKNGSIADIGENIDLRVSEYDYRDGSFTAILNPDTPNGGIIYILGEHEGKLAVLSPDKTIIYRIFDVYINTLPVYDRELLNNGIKVKSEEELNSLVEDYNS